MSSALQKKSDKLHVIDQKTYEKIQKQKASTADVTQRIIRNSKYKKKSAATGGSAATFDLLQFLTPAPRGRQKAQKELRRRGVRRVLASSAVTKPPRKRGKTREGGKRKQCTRLKKSILAYRLSKRQQEHSPAEVLLQRTTEELSALVISADVQEEVNVRHANVAKNVHSRRFREYCENCTTPLLGQLAEELLRELNRFQRRAYAQNEIKARAHRRFVVGFREVKSYLRIKKVKLVIIAPDCETCDGEAGIDETITDIKSECLQQQIPYAFSLRRRQLAYTLYKKVPISCVAVLDYDGAREIFAKLLTALQEARQAFEVLIAQSLQLDNSDTSLLS